MAGATVEAEQEPETAEGAPQDGGAEATRTAGQLFQYSQYVHAGEGAAECEHREDGKCNDDGHFHAWVCMPNSIQNRDIEEKAAAARARRKRALRDTDSDAYVTLEAQIDDILAEDREHLVTTVTEREVRKKMVGTIDDVRQEERFEHYGQDREEHNRLEALAEEDRPTEEWDDLQRRMTEFADAVEGSIKQLRSREEDRFKAFDDAAMRSHLREWQIETQGQEAFFATYYLWLGYICTRKPGPRDHGKRVFGSLEEFRAAPPEAVAAIDDCVRDLETRLIRGDAAGN